MKQNYRKSSMILFAIFFPFAALNIATNEEETIKLSSFHCVYPSVQFVLCSFVIYRKKNCVICVLLVFRIDFGIALCLCYLHFNFVFITLHCYLQFGNCNSSKFGFHSAYDFFLYFSHTKLCVHTSWALNPY